MKRITALPLLFVLICLLNTAPITATPANVVAHTAYCLARQIGVWGVKKTQKTILENPQESAGAVVGSYFGYKSAGDSKVHGFLAGALVGWHLARQRVVVKALETQVATNAAQVAVLESNFSAQIGAVENRISVVLQYFQKQADRLLQMQQANRACAVKVTHLETQVGQLEQIVIHQQKNQASPIANKLTQLFSATVRAVRSSKKYDQRVQQTQGLVALGYH